MDRKLRFFIRFAKMIRPGWRATALFYFLFIPVRLIAPRKKLPKKTSNLFSRTKLIPKKENS